MLISIMLFFAHYIQSSIMNVVWLHAQIHSPHTVLTFSLGCCCSCIILPSPPHSSTAKVFSTQQQYRILEQNFSRGKTNNRAIYTLKRYKCHFNFQQCKYNTYISNLYTFMCIYARARECMCVCVCVCVCACRCVYVYGNKFKNFPTIFFCD